jgi:hypothetical protein
MDQKSDLDFWMIWGDAVAYEAKGRGRFLEHVDADIFAAVEREYPGSGIETRRPDPTMASLSGSERSDSVVRLAKRRCIVGTCSPWTSNWIRLDIRCRFCEQPSGKRTTIPSKFQICLCHVILPSAIYLPTPWRGYIARRKRCQQLRQSRCHQPPRPHPATLQMSCSPRHILSSTRWISSWQENSSPAHSRESQIMLLLSSYLERSNASSGILRQVDRCETFSLSSQFFSDVLHLSGFFNLYLSSRLTRLTCTSPSSPSLPKNPSNIFLPHSTSSTLAYPVMRRLMQRFRTSGLKKRPNCGGVLLVLWSV